MSNSTCQISAAFSAVTPIEVPPGTFLHPFTLDHTVVSCEQAAQAKDILLINELKTLILDTSVGMVAVHLRGDRRLSLRDVKKRLSCKEASIASKEQLASMGLVRGAVSAVLDPVWSMPHLVCENLLALEYVSTNNGTHNQYFKFRPETLLHAPNVRVGLFDSLPLN